ncbi:DUF4230 domain-containing protein [Haloferula chungangensis]|uniref:DUF4230 domain-containing protein n=1 Tax=Haloferula chungangensis TaxID=1048331 RepID=A0ABW2L984_9BACT
MSHHPELWKTVRWIAFLAAIVALGFLGVKMIDRNIAGASNGLDKILGALTNSDTRIVEGRAVISEQNEISELSLLELRMSATRSFEHENYVLKYLPTGTKKLIVRGDYRITAGYKLKPGVSLAVEGGVPVARFPEAEILGVELIDFTILSEKDGWANSITAEDRATLLRELRQQMRMEAEKSGVLDVVDGALRTRMKDLIGSDQVRIEHAESP